jgi:hypothetical protein
MEDWNNGILNKTKKENSISNSLFYYSIFPIISIDFFLRSTYKESNWWGTLDERDTFAFYYFKYIKLS